MALIKEHLLAVFCHALTLDILSLLTVFGERLCESILSARLIAFGKEVLATLNRGYSMLVMLLRVFIKRDLARRIVKLSPLIGTKRKIHQFTKRIRQAS
jgi:hypothetical protein